MKPLVSLQDLAWRLQIPLPELKALAKDVNKHYREWISVNEKTGKARNFKAPDAQLKKVQRRILKQVLMQYPLSDAVHGGTKGRSPKSNAACHLGKSVVVQIDVRNFFPSVSHRLVAKMFTREYRCGRDTAWLLTRLTTVDGQLPQGAPTSTFIANVLLSNPVDRPIREQASVLGIDLTRFVDDIALSGESAQSLINQTVNAVAQAGLGINRKKLKISPRYHRQEVTGLTVNMPNGPSIARYKRDRVRAAIHQLVSMSHTDREHALNSIHGRLNYVKQFNPSAAKRMYSQLDEVLKQMDG